MKQVKRIHAIFYVATTLANTCYPYININNEFTKNTRVANYQQSFSQCQQNEVYDIS